MAVTRNAKAQPGTDPRAHDDAHDDAHHDACMRVPTQGPRFARRAGGVAALGLAGVGALLLQPLPSDLGPSAPAMAPSVPEMAPSVPAIADWPPLAVQALLALNPALFVAVAALAGAALAHRVGLRSLVAGTASGRVWAGTMGRSAAVGFILGLGAAAVDTLVRPALGEAWQRLEAHRPTGVPTLAFGMLYGGLAEEVMLRWGVMSLAATALAALPGLRRRARAMPGAMVLAALLFAAAHLPALSAQIELTPLVVTRTLCLNGAAGLVYGWLFWRHHLEAAMAAHASTHLGLWAWRGLVA